MVDKIDVNYPNGADSVSLVVEDVILPGMEIHGKLQRPVFTLHPGWHFWAYDVEQFQTSNAKPEGWLRHVEIQQEDLAGYEDALSDWEDPKAVGIDVKSQTIVGITLAITYRGRGPGVYVSDSGDKVVVAEGKVVIDGF